MPQWNELHEVPHDYLRYTNFGLQKLFEENGFTVEVMDQRGKYHALLAQLHIRHLIDRFKPYDRPLMMLWLGPLTKLMAVWALWRDSMSKKPADALHAIGWCVLARKQ